MSWMKEPFYDWKENVESWLRFTTLNVWWLSQFWIQSNSKEYHINRKKGTCSVSFISHCIWCNSIGQPRNDNEKYMRKWGNMQELTELHRYTFRIKSSRIISKWFIFHFLLCNTSLILKVSYTINRFWIWEYIFKK